MVRKSTKRENGISRVRSRGRPVSYRDEMRPFLALREQGATFPAISRAISAATGEQVSSTTVRRWVKLIEDGEQPGQLQDAPSATDRLSIYLTPEQREQLEDAVHLVRRGTGRALKLTTGTLARNIIQAAFARGLLEELATVDGPEAYERALLAEPRRARKKAKKARKRR